MSVRCKIKKCKEYRHSGFEFCELHLRGITKKAVSLTLCNILDQKGYSQLIDSLPHEKLKDYGVDSLDTVEMIMMLEKDLKCSIPDSISDVFGEDITLEDCIEGLSSHFIDNGEYFNIENVTRNPLQIYSKEKLEYVFSDNIYKEAFKELSLNIDEIEQTLKSLLQNNNIIYVTAIPNDNKDKKLQSLEMFVLSDKSLFVYSFMFKKIEFKIISRSDLNLDYEFIFNSEGNISEIILHFKTKSYLAYEPKTFRFTGNYSINKTLIFLSKYAKEV